MKNGLELVTPGPLAVCVRPTGVVGYVPKGSRLKGAPPVNIHVRSVDGSDGIRTIVNWKLLTNKLGAAERAQRRIALRKEICGNGRNERI